MLGPSKSILMTHDRKEKQRKVTFFDFKGLMAPVFTCFENNEKYTLNVDEVDRYAGYLKKNYIKGVLVNGITGEGPAMSLNERLLNAEKWWQAATKHDLICVIQIGGAPIPDVILMAEQAENLGVHAVLCLPDLSSKPENIEMLIRYCRTVTKHCMSRPFFYYHIPRYTGVDFDMSIFCREAEKSIPYFYGIQFSSPDLQMGYKCLREGRVILLGFDSLLASGLLLGFDSALLAVLNIRPDLGFEILDAMSKNNMSLAKEKQMILNQSVAIQLGRSSAGRANWVSTMKNWFNEENAAKMSVGPVRKFMI